MSGDPNVTHDDRQDSLSKMIGHCRARGMSADYIIGVLTRAASHDAADWRIAMQVLNQRLTELPPTDGPRVPRWSY